MVNGGWPPLKVGGETTWVDGSPTLAATVDDTWVTWSTTMAWAATLTGAVSPPAEGFDDEVTFTTTKAMTMTTTTETTTKAMVEGEKRWGAAPGL
jgi:hypothetical protein